MDPHSHRVAGVQSRTRHTMGHDHNGHDSNDAQGFPDVDAAAAEFDALQARVKAAEDELANEKARVLRVMADYQNYQRRAYTNEQNARIEGTIKAIMNIVPLIDHFDQALVQDPKTSSAEQVLQGVRLIKDEFIRGLARFNVAIISPAANDEFQPGRHEAVMQMTGDGVDPGRVVMTMQPGFGMLTETGERILRAAKVAVAP
jgi:molecular chaperone GrpE